MPPPKPARQRTRKPTTVPKPLARESQRAAKRAVPGPAPKELNLTTCTNAGLIGCTNDEIATLLGISRTTFYDRMTHEPAIGEAIEAGRNNGKSTLRRLQWALAKQGNVTMLIWLGKQLLGQKDKVEHGVDEALEDLLGKLAAESAHGPHERTKPAA